MTRVAKSILFVEERMGFGGTPRNVVNLANEFATLGYRVEVLTLSGVGELLDELDRSVRITCLRSGSVQSIFPLLWHFLRHRKDYDLIIPALHLPNLLTLLSRSLTFATGTVAISLHTPLRPRLDRHGSRALRLVCIAAKFVYRLADAVIAVSDGVKMDAVATFGVHPQDITVIYNPIYSASSCDRHAPNPYGHHGKMLLMACGVFKPVKNFALLVEAMFHVVKVRKDVVLYLVGDGPERARLQEQISALRLETNIAMTGFVKDPFPYYYHADLFVLASAYEGLGNVLIEALCAGTPVLAANSAGPDEILVGGLFGRLIDAPTPESLSVAILEEIEKPRKERSFYQGRAKDFDVRIVAQQYLRVAFP